jgi:iron complex transport system substrate-binding protein
MKNRHFFVFMAAVCMALILGGMAWGAEPPMTLEGRQITDQSGHRILVSAPYHRIISLYGAHTENLFALGCGDALIGVGRNDRFPAAARLKPVFNYREDAEKFLAARPDLVLIRPMIAAGCPQLVERLQANGITVLSLQPSSVEEMYRYWRILGVLTGHEQAAEAMVAGFRKQVDAYRALTAAIEPKKRVFFEAIHSKMKTFAPDAMAIFVLECAGGVNAAADAVGVRGSNIAEFGKERLLARGEGIDVYLAQTGPMNRPPLAPIREEPGFRAVRAVREGKISLVDEALVSRPTLRLLDGIATVGAILYPDRFPAAAEEKPSVPRPAHAS